MNSRRVNIPAHVDLRPNPLLQRFIVLLLLMPLLLQGSKVGAEHGTMDLKISVNAWWFAAHNDSDWQAITNAADVLDYVSVADDYMWRRLVEGNTSPSPDTALKSRIDQLHAKGVKVLYYVDTGGFDGTTRFGGGSNPPTVAWSVADIKATIDHAYANYAIDGIFLDQVYYVPDGDYRQGNFLEVARHIRGKQGVRGTAINVNSAGWHGGTSGAYIMDNVDMVWVVEDTLGYWENDFHLDMYRWLEGRPAAKKHAHITATADAAGMRRALELAQQRGFGSVFATSSTPDNYGGLPSYFNDLVTTVRAINSR